MEGEGEREEKTVVGESVCRLNAVLRATDFSVVAFHTQAWLEAHVGTCTSTPIAGIVRRHTVLPMKIGISRVAVNARQTFVGQPKSILA